MLGFYTENKVFVYAEMSDLREDLIKKARQMAINNSGKSHSWTDMSDEEMLRSLNLIEKDLNAGKEGLTLAAILLFGKDTTILSALPHHKTDAIFFKEIGLAEELGSGIKNMVKYTQIYSQNIPEFKEDDIFTTIIPLNAQEMPKKILTKFN